jgi:hypothetical protein
MAGIVPAIRASPASAMMARPSPAMPVRRFGVSILSRIGLM